MTNKKNCWAVLLMFAGIQLNGQSFSGAAASTGAEIIEPVGTERSGDMLTGSFYSGRESATIQVSKNGIQLNGKNSGMNPGQAGAPSFHIISSQQAYSITTSFDPFIHNRDQSGETIRIGSVNFFPVSEWKQGQNLPDVFSIGATLLVAPNQAPGRYHSDNPYTITVHFN